MRIDDFAERLSFVGRPLPPAFERREVTVGPGDERAFVETEWQDAVVVVQDGEVELDCLAGATRRFPEGSVLCLVGLPLRALCNRGDEPVTLVAVSRRR